MLEDLAIQQTGSKEKLSTELAERIASDGDTKALLDLLFPSKEWDEKSIAQIQQVEHMDGFNDLTAGIVSTDLGKAIISSDEISEVSNPLSIAFLAIGIYEWLGTKALSMESLEYDINLSKNTRRTWLNFFFEEPSENSGRLSQPHRFYKVRKITPQDYIEIRKKFILVNIPDFNQDTTEKLNALKKGWVVSKKDLKDAYNKRSADIKSALEDAVEQPDYPSSWPKAIPDKDKFPYSVSLFIARELSLM